jgi:hypothetical protein
MLVDKPRQAVRAPLKLRRMQILHYGPIRIAFSTARDPAS